MDSASMNHYEKQLYSVFKSFDVDNEEALDRPAVVELCDALQLEDRGSALVDTLFERRAGRVTFSQFRNGLLSVLGGEASSQASFPASQTSPLKAPTVSSTPPQSDDDSSGREVAPKFTFGAKKYGRRSRPPRVNINESPRHRVASESRLDGERVKQRMKCKRSSSAMETRADSVTDDDVLDLDHDQRVNRDRSLKLCQSLQMHGVDRRFVDRVFEEMKTDEMTVGQFFDRLNSSLQSSIQASLDGSITDDCAAIDVDVIPSDIVVEAWERAGVQKPRRLLHELGFTVVAVQPRDLERALDDELQALGSFPNVSEPRSLLLLAANTLVRLRVDMYRRRLDVAIAERDKLRSDLMEANRRARLLAQDVDENHARIESELKASLHQVEAKHAEAARVSAAEAAAERERAALARRELEVEMARRADIETRLRVDLATCNERNQELEERMRETETRATQAERECLRIMSEARAAAERDAALAERERTTVAELNARLLELRNENQQLRDRNDELCAAVEAVGRGERGPVSDEPACWRDETDGHSPILASPCRSQRDSLAVSEDGYNAKTQDHILQEIVAKFSGIPSESGKCERCSALTEIIASIKSREFAPMEVSVQTDASSDEVETLRKEIVVLKATHELEMGNLNNIIKDLECSLDQLREEYDKCEDYWSQKLDEERELWSEEQKAGDERLRALSDEIARYERQFASALPALSESALEDQYMHLDDEFRDYRQDKESELARKMEDISKQKQHIGELEQRLSALEQQQQQQQQLQQRQQQQQQQHQRSNARHCTDIDVQRMQTRCAGAGASEAGLLRARAARAERAAQRLHARLAAADLLVKDLYIENCRLAHLPHLPHAPHLPHGPLLPHVPHAPRLP